MSGTMDPSSEGKLIMTTTPIYPQADPWTVEDLDRLPDGLHYEIIDGSLLVSPPPAAFHQVAALRLVDQIKEALPDDLEVLSPSGVDVAVSYLEPDIAVVRADAIDANPNRFTPSDLVLVVEVISPTSWGGGARVASAPGRGRPPAGCRRAWTARGRRSPRSRGCGWRSGRHRRAPAAPGTR